MSAPTGDRHPDTVIVDVLTAFLNRGAAPAGSDAIDLMSALIRSSGRPLLAETWDLHAEVTEDRYGLATATVIVGSCTIRVAHAADDSADLGVEIVTDDDARLAVTINDCAVRDTGAVHRDQCSTSTSSPRC